MTGPGLKDEDVAARFPRAAVIAAAVPWSWFLLREVSGVAGDVVAILLPLFVVALALAASVVAWWWRWWLVPAGSVLVMGAVSVLGPWLPADAGVVVPGAATTVVGANVQAQPDLAAALLAQSADVLALAEMTPGLEPALAAYPYHHTVFGGPDVGLFSRFPLRVLEDPGADLPGIRAEVDGPGGPFVLYALHVPRPWFTTRGEYQATVAEHHVIMERVAARVAVEQLPVVVVGDLNSPDRGRDYRRLLDRGGMVDAMRDTLGSFTSVAKWTPLLLRIDHLVVTEGWCGDGSARFALPGSDHRGITAAVGPCSR